MEKENLVKLEIKKKSPYNEKEFRLGTDYVNKSGLRLTQIHKDLIQETKDKFPKNALMLGGKDSAFLMSNLIKIQNGKKGFEIGVFTGFSTLIMAEALPEDGLIYAIDVNKEFTDLGKKYWKKGNVDNKIHLDLSGAAGFLKDLIKDEANHNSFDFAFVDADKTGYPEYFELLLVLLRKGGWIAFDNAFCGGNLIGKAHIGFTKEAIESMRGLNQKLNSDTRVSNVLLNIADGLHLVVKN